MRLIIRIRSVSDARGVDDGGKQSAHDKVFDRLDRCVPVDHLLDIVVLATTLGLALLDGGADGRRHLDSADPLFDGRGDGQQREVGGHEAGVVCKRPEGRLHGFDGVDVACVLGEADEQNADLEDERIDGGVHVDVAATGQGLEEIHRAAHHFGQIVLESGGAEAAAQVLHESVRAGIVGGRRLLEPRGQLWDAGKHDLVAVVEVETAIVEEGLAVLGGVVDDCHDVAARVDAHRVLRRWCAVPCLRVAKHGAQEAVALRVELEGPEAGQERLCICFDGAVTLEAGWGAEQVPCEERQHDRRRGPKGGRRDERALRRYGEELRRHDGEADATPTDKGMVVVVVWGQTAMLAGAVWFDPKVAGRAAELECRQAVWSARQSQHGDWARAITVPSG
ncbi:hypothetical protein L1887_50649 [Cichorium endivia]|nr:hypothetical protein L1887_50649 [Cichorium endivia]